MKRRVEEATKVEGVPPALHAARSPHSAPNVVQPTYATISKSGGPPDVNIQQYPLANFVTMPSITASVKAPGSLGGGSGSHSSGILVTSQFRHNKAPPTGGGTTPPAVVGSAGAPNVSGPTQQFQRLKVEDALSYLDQVKYKFNSQPQVYNDFLEIMKEFKSQCIDTPGVIARVSHLFKGYPELISGFNTFLPPGYKIEVQANDTGYSLQVSVSNPLGHPTMQEIPPLTPTQPHSVVVTNQTTKPPSNYQPTVASSNVVTTNVGPTTSAPSHLVKTAPGGPPTIERAAPPSTALSISGPPERSPAIATVSSIQGAQVLTGAATLGAASTLASAGVGVPTLPNLAAANHQAGQQQTNQPVEFNHAINYVNKIKNRFQGQPDKYKKFLEILHTYQKEQKNVKGSSGGGGGIVGPVSGGKHLTEAEVYSQVAQLFENHDDLLVEFGQFLPDATSHNSSLSLASLVSTSNHHSSKLNERKTSLSIKYNSCSSSNRIEGNGRERERERNDRDERSIPTKTSPPSSAPKTIGINKRASEIYNNTGGPNSPGSAHHVPQVPVKRQKLSSHSHSSSFPHFDAIKRAFRNPLNYEQLLRCFHLFNIEIISKAELIALITPLLVRLPEHLNYFKEYLGETGPIILPRDREDEPPRGRSSAPVSPPTPTHHPIPPPYHMNTTGPPPMPAFVSTLDPHPISNNRINSEPRSSDLLTPASTADIDFSSCKRIGASYCALPKNVPPPRCSGRTMLCRQVLNDTWVSFPTWSEDSTFVTSRKTQYEEYIYRCEDERFELDLVIESNAATILVLENIQKRMSRMTPEELSKFTLEDNLGGTSNTIHIRAIKRIYGDKAGDVIEGLKQNPSVAVPLVLRRLRAKENEWRHAQKGFNKTWRDQNEKFYLKSLDHQGINFKQNDLKALRSKSLYNEIETAYDERHESEEPRTGPHIFLTYTDKNILDDAANLLIHHVKRQTTIHKQDKQRIKQLLRQSIPDMFHHRRQELSDDERESGNTQGGLNNNRIKSAPQSPVRSGGPVANCKSPMDPSAGQESPAVVVKQEEHPTKYPDEVYTLFFGNNNWYLFLRLHQILCDRLAKMSERSIRIAEEEAQHSLNRKESTTAMLRLKPNEQWQDCYGSMLDMVKSVLDCSMESQTYEDTLRNMFGIHAYIGFTLDKIVTYAVRQLQQLVTDDCCVECWELHNTYRTKGGAGGPVATAADRAAMEACYLRDATNVLSGENCYKIYIYKKECKVTVELLDTESEEEEGGGSDSAIGPGKSSGGGGGNGGKWSDYENRLGGNSDKADSGVSLSDKERFGPPTPMFLNRLLRHGKKSMPGASESNSKNSEKCLGVGSHQKVFVIDKNTNNDILKKTGCLVRARQTHCAVTRRKYSKFQAWYSRWAAREVSRSDMETTNVWFMGRAPNTHPNVTKAVETDPADKRTPYRKYNRYTVNRTSNS